MKKLLITLIILVSQLTGYSQSEPKPSKQKVYNIKLREINGNLLTGKLVRATTDSLYVNLGNQPTGSFYQLTPEQVDQIVEILRDSIRETVSWARRNKPSL